MQYFVYNADKARLADFASSEVANFISKFSWNKRPKYLYDWA